MKSIVWMTQEILRMPSLHAVDHPTFPVNQRFFHLVVIQEDCSAATNSRQIFGTRRVFRETFLQIQPYPGGFNPWDFWHNGRHTCTHKYAATRYMRWTSDSRHSLDSEISARTVSRKFTRPWGGKILKELWGRPTKTADLGTSLWQIPYTNNICLLEDKIQNRDAKIASALNKIIHNSQFKGESVWRNKRPRSRPFPSWQTDCLPDLWVLPGSLGAMIVSKTTPTYSLSFYEMTIFRNSILSGTEYYCPWRKSRMMTSWKDCTN